MEIPRYAVRSKELSTVLGGGIVPGSFILLSGEPGIGKSTLTLQMADWFSTEQQQALYISAEENLAQISGRARRLGIQNAHIRILCESVFENILETIERDTSKLIILDSISVFQSVSLDTNAWSASLIRSMSEVLMQVAKKGQKTIIVIGHVTKDGSISGPKTLEHLVDTVLFLEWSRYESYRILRALKNRFGPTDEIGLFAMTELGLQDIVNPWLEFSGSNREHLIGSALAMTLEGTRPLVVEIEALTTYTKFGYPKRSSRGIPTGKLDLVLAILSKYTDAKLESYDVFANIGRWLSVSEPGVDLALAAAILASRRNFSLGNTIFIGELSLTGVIKPVVAQERRVEEARRLGFTKIIEAKKPQAKAGKQKSESSKEATQTISVSTVSELVQALGRIASDVATHPQKEENE
jgi:DNA repair protein RadA/Sms